MLAAYVPPLLLEEGGGSAWFSMAPAGSWSSTVCAQQNMVEWMGVVGSSHNDLSTELDPKARAFNCPAGNVAGACPLSPALLPGII
jgi:hypothetical protein